MEIIDFKLKLLIQIRIIKKEIQFIIKTYMVIIFNI